MVNIILMLAIHQDVQNRLYTEIIEIIPNLDFVDINEIDKMDYMECVIKETMRFIPLSLILLRENLTNIKLKNCIIPKNTIIFLSILKMHRNPIIWGKNADKFLPERFQHEYEKLAYVPFSVGPRNCIGSKYAMISMKIMLCFLLTHYKFKTDIKLSDIRMKFEILLKLENACMVKLERR